MQLLSYLKNLLGSSADEKEARELARCAEASARKLHGLPPRPEAGTDDLREVLSSVCLLLERAAERQPSPPEEGSVSRPEAAAAPAAGEEPAEEAAPAEETAPAGEVRLSEASTAAEDLEPGRREAQAEAAAPPPQPPPPLDPASGPPAAAPDGVLSPTAKELIKLRDWVLLAKSGGAPAADALEGVYKKLAQVLKREGVTPLEENTAFDEERQQIMDTRPTRDPAQDNVVCDTVRPGYVFNGDVIRPQEVIIFTYEPEAAGAPPAPHPM